MIPRFYIIGSQAERPSSRKTIYADGSADSNFREGIDLELSHWLPNHTPDAFKADTSTEICMNFVSKHSSEGWDLAINNHLDVDGLLAVFTLVKSELALQHRETIVRAAEMGDFWAYGEETSQVLFQGLTLYYQQLRKEKMDVGEIYQHCFARIESLLKEDHRHEEGIREGLAALQKSVERVHSGEISRELYHDRFVHYRVPASLTKESLEKAWHVPLFNAPLSEEMWLLPAVRDKFDHEKIHLVSAEVKEGWYYDLWYPGYMWADTPNSWQAPGFVFSGSTNGYSYGHEPLQQAVSQLQELESQQGREKGRWVLVEKLSPFSSIKGRNYPVVLSFVDDENQPVASRLQPKRVAEILAKAFA